MTDIERDRVKAICEVAGVKEIDDLSDGFHTFRQLYYQRMVLFAAIVKQNKDKAWKSLRHEDGELCFGGGWFIVGIDTPKGSYTYHYEDNYFSLFDCVELERGKHWDGHTEKDVVRLLSLPSVQPEQGWIPVTERKNRMDDLIRRQDAIDAIQDEISKESHRPHQITLLHAKRRIENLLPAQQWIPVNTLNDIPDHEVICCDKEGELIIGYMWCDCGQWICESPGEVMYNPVAYMEKPETYKEEQNDDR